MKKKNLLKLMALSLCTVTCLGVGVTLSACNSDSEIQFVEEEKKVGPQFLEGALADVLVYDTIVLNEYIEYVTDSSYTITIKDEKGNVQDLTDQVIWYTDAPGDYVITYTVKSGASKGVSTFTLRVRNPELSWDFTLKNMPYNLGDTLVFEEYFNEMNIAASLENYEVIMDCVEVDGEEIDLKDNTEFTFESRSDHTFKFYIEASDGQRCDGREVISVKDIDKAYLQQLEEEMNISLYGDLYLNEENGYTMVEGSYCNGNNVWLRRENGPHNLPYIAYNGEYGIGDFVKVDFTGKNMPTFSFFRDEYSQSIFDGTKGVVFTGGFSDNNGNAIHPTKNNNFTLYGPYMLHEYDRSASDTTQISDSPGSGDTAYPGSFNALQDGTRYRMIAGFSDLEKGKAGLLPIGKDDDGNSVDTLFLTFKCVILNLDTNEVVSEFSMKTYGIQALRFLEIPLDTENNEFFTGNIVLYGQHGRRTTLDKIYPVITGKTFEEIYKEEVPRAEFKETAKAFVLLNTEINLFDYADMTKEGAKFFYRDADGVDYPVEGSSFTITQEGRYTLFYKYGNLYYGSLNIFVGDLKYNATMDENGKIVLGEGSIGNGGSYIGPNNNDLIDQAYVAFTGEYSFSDYVAMDFTGKNMPEIAFFANDFDNSMYAGKGGKKGVVVASGITLWDGSLNGNVFSRSTSIGVSGPYMANFNAASKDASGDLIGAFSSKLARANLDDNTKYRVIIGFEKAEDPRAIVLKFALYNLDTGALVEETSQVSWNLFSNNDFYSQSRDTLVGSIILYGKFRATTTIDKFWGIYEDTTIADVKAAIEAI